MDVQKRDDSRLPVALALHRSEVDLPHHRPERQILAIDCGDRICSSYHQVRPLCHVFVSANDSVVCQMPCNMNGCVEELHRDINCLLWTCDTKPTTTTTTRSTTSTMPTSTTPSPASDCTTLTCILSVTVNTLIVLAAICCISYFVVKRIRASRRQSRRPSTDEERHLLAPLPTSQAGEPSAPPSPVPGSASAPPSSLFSAPQSSASYDVPLDLEETESIAILPVQVSGIQNEGQSQANETKPLLQASANKNEEKSSGKFLKMMLHFKNRKSAAASSTAQLSPSTSGSTLVTSALPSTSGSTLMASGFGRSSASGSTLMRSGFGRSSDEGKSFLQKLRNLKSKKVESSPTASTSSFDRGFISAWEDPVTPPFDSVTNFQSAAADQEQGFASFLPSAPPMLSSASLPNLN